MMKLFVNPARVLPLGLFLGIFLLASCVTTPQSESGVEQRVVARWGALLEGDYIGAYDFLSPGYRSSVSLNQYQRSLLLSKVRWTSAKYIESECTDNVCKVKNSLDYALHGALPGVNTFNGTQIVEESWVLVDGDWYFVPKE